MKNVGTAALNISEVRLDGATSDEGEIVFEGQRFDVMAVRRWREQALAVP